MVEESSSKKMFFEYGTSRFGMEGKTGPGQQVDFWINGNDGAGTVLSTSFVVSDWTHLVLMIDGSKKRLYTNSYLAAEVAFTNAIAGTLNSSFKIGGRSATQYTHSEFDDVRIYNRSLSSNEVSQLFNLP